MPTQLKMIFRHPAPDGPARVLRFWFNSTTHELASKLVRVPYWWTDKQIEAECVEWCTVINDQHQPRQATGGWEDVFLWDVDCWTGRKAPRDFMVVLAANRENARAIAARVYRRKYALHVMDVIECQTADVP